MIVVDANILVYRIVEGEMTGAAIRLQEKDPDWRTSPLWEYEFGNALALMILQKHLTTKMAAQLFQNAKGVFIPAEMQADSDLALQLASEKKISFYDAQYLALAQMLGVPLITEDKALRKAAGDLAVSLNDFVN
jgi:predicted nucleic acid-binding protein